MQTPYPENQDLVLASKAGASSWSLGQHVQKAPRRRA